MSVIFKSPIGFTLNHPSSAPWGALKKIMLSELKLESTSPGSYLLVETTSLQKISVTFNDEQGNTYNVRNYLQDGQQFLSETYANATHIILREPFCKGTGNGKSIILILHLSDILVMEPNDLLLPSIWRSKITGENSVSQLKKKGNSQLKQRQYYEAIDSCQARLSIYSPETALEDAKFILTSCSRGIHAPEFGKALLSCARALYRLQKFQECFAKIQEYCQLYPNDELAVVELERCRRRVEETVIGHFDFASWVAAVAEKVKERQPPLIDAATYQGPIIVRRSGNGYGLFTTRDVEAGDLLLCEKAFSCAFDFVTCPPIDKPPTNKKQPSLESGKKKQRRNATNSRAPVRKKKPNFDSLGEPIDVKLQLGTLHRIHRNPVTYLQPFLSLYGGIAQTAMASPGVLDSTLNLHIIEKNKLTWASRGSLAALHSLSIRPDNVPGKSSDSPKDTPAASSKDVPTEWPKDIQAVWPTDIPAATVPAMTHGMWFLASRINHSCLPNISRAIIGDMLILRASTSIPANTEIFDSYMAGTDPYPLRRTNLKRTFGFVCQCVICKMDQSISNKLHARRESFSQLLVSCLIMPTTDSWKEVAPTLEKLAATYPPSEAYPGVPRLAMLLPLYSIARALFANGQATVAVIYFALQLLQEMGFRFTIGADEGDFVIEHWGFMTNAVPEVLWMMRETVEKESPTWQGLDGALWKAYLICNGEEASFDSCYGNSD
ncbi:MAG: hypothetical protein Q9168_006804 [Polycauliona sp. 1 TL-2023]